MIQGDAGIGKTALVRAVIAAALTRGYGVLRCAGEQAEARLSFAGVADLVGEAVGRGSFATSVTGRSSRDWWQLVLRP